jgi:hypothetical protein
VALLAGLLSLQVAPGLAQERSRAVAAIFSPLKTGHKVSLEEKGGLFAIRLFNDGALGAHAVIELGEHHIVLEDVSGTNRLWIPVTAIREVIWVRVPR